MTHHTIAVGHIAQILQGARSRGVDVERVLMRAQVSPGLLHASMARVSQAQLAQVLRRLRRATHDDFLGMGRHPVPLGAFDNACRLALQAYTVGQALRVAFRYYHGVLRDFTARLCVSGDTARIVLDSRGAAHAQQWYGERTFLFFTLGVANWLAARRIPILGVDYRGGARSADAHKVFHAPVRYGQAMTGLRLMDIAQRLGFSEPSTFHRAFKKWTGVSPGEYRRNQREDAAVDALQAP